MLFSISGLFSIIISLPGRGDRYGPFDRNFEAGMPYDHRFEAELRGTMLKREMMECVVMYFAYLWVVYSEEIVFQRIGYETS
ncbi:unnamed protein product [Strongylus vulgaris]|uniref:Uncharacterized protein n=1 Tax=Strongylus vulgaris TaxID=40348 RepID=A0A3P7IZV6_STRVU|nr:unnamed protein product [Strongylus vulgaris]